MSSSSSSNPRTEAIRPYPNFAFSIKPILFNALCNVVFISRSIRAIGIFKSSHASIAPIISEPGSTSTSAPIFDWKYPRSVLTKNNPTLFSLIILVIWMLSSSSTSLILFLIFIYRPLSSSIATISGCCS